MQQLEDWAFTTKVRKTLVTPDMVRELSIRKTVFIGRMMENGEVLKRGCFQSAIVRNTNGQKIITDEGVFQLGKPSKMYQEFREAASVGMPTVMNWVIGKNAILSANVYEKGKVSYLCEKVIGQDFDRRTLQLESGRIVFVVWQNVNYKFLCHLKQLSKWIVLKDFFPTRECPLQMDILRATEEIWSFKTMIDHLQPYEWILKGPYDFSILNER